MNFPTWEELGRKAVCRALDEMEFVFENETIGFHDFCDKVNNGEWARVKHGKWIKSDIPCEEYVYSECGGACWYYDYRATVAKSRYCPNCGAKMDFEDNMR